MCLAGFQSLCLLWLCVVWFTLWYVAKWLLCCGSSDGCRDFITHTCKWDVKYTATQLKEYFLCPFLSIICQSCAWETNIESSRQTDEYPVLCSPSDHWQYEPGAGLCASADLLALWQRVGLQTLCLCPHTPHAPHAGGGGGQLMVVCNNFLSICQQLCES